MLAWATDLLLRAKPSWEEKNVAGQTMSEVGFVIAARPELTRDNHFSSRKPGV